MKPEQPRKDRAIQHAAKEGRQKGIGATHFGENGATGPRASEREICL